MKTDPIPSDQSPEVKFEIGHVLFIDIVAYSRLLISEQSEQIQSLRRIVRGTEQFRMAESEGKVLRLPETAEPSFSSPLQKHLSFAPWKLAKRSGIIPSSGCGWEFTAGQ